MIDFTWKIGGEAGFGIKTTGNMFAKTMMRAGLHVFDYIEYPSLIRGGHNVTEIRVSAQEVFAPKKSIDMLVALNKATLALHRKELASGAAIIYDRDQFEADGTYSARDIQLVHVPFLALLKKSGGTKVMENNVALGASLALLGMNLKVLSGVIEDQFKKKGVDVVRENQQAAAAGYQYVRNYYQKLIAERVFKLNKLFLEDGQEQMLVTGNDAVALGAIAAGCKLYIAYPMTPASSILHTLAALAENSGMLIRHAEDEIAVINSACGASFAGVRTMVGTSGGGLSLMVEGLGLVGLTESPLVIVDAQRPGPATGMPTWTAQGDLRFVLHAHQDDFPRIVLAPGDVEEAFTLTWQAFNYAEIYQTAVFILLDKYLSESHKSVPIFDPAAVKIDRGKFISSDEAWDRRKKGEYLRYKITADGIPYRAIPGLKKTLFTANSYEHDEYGLSSESPQDRVAQVNRRQRKLATFDKVHLPPAKIYGAQDAQITLIGWGSTKGPVLQAINDLSKLSGSPAVNYLHLNYLWPFPAESVKKKLAQAKKLLLLEGNHAAELDGLIRQETGILIENKYLKYDGRPFYAEDIKARVRELTS